MYHRASGSPWHAVIPEDLNAHERHHENPKSHIHIAVWNISVELLATWSSKTFTSLLHILSASPSFWTKNVPNPSLLSKCVMVYCYISKCNFILCPKEMYDLQCTIFYVTQMFNSNMCRSYTEFQPYWTVGEEIDTLDSRMAFGTPSLTKCVLLNSITWEFYIPNFIPPGQQA
jgi:hypothetical protein